MLVLILILETPRRGLILGKKIKFHKRFLQIIRDYHGYIITWGLIYTFWYHPMENTFGHLAGLFLHVQPSSAIRLPFQPSTLQQILDLFPGNSRPHSRHSCCHLPSQWHLAYVRLWFRCHDHPHSNIWLRSQTMAPQNHLHSFRPRHHRVLHNHK